MNLQSLTIYHVTMELIRPFTTHASEVTDRELLLLELTDQEGRSGWGECVAFSTPFYTEETVHTAWHMIKDLYAPHLSNLSIDHPADIPKELSVFQGNPMAKAGIEAAAWDLYAKQRNKSLHEVIGGVRDVLEVGVVISLNEPLEELIPLYISEGYRRFKLKVTKGKEREQLEKVRNLAPELPLMIDGNGMYGEEDIAHLAALDDLNLLMIEQPFPPGDFYLHQQLQKRMETPICLDESIRSYHDAYQAVQLQSCQIMNIKVGRVGGMGEALRIHELCKEHDIPVWCGGMLESGVSRAHNLALASLANFSIPGDISASKRYWHKDVIIPEVQVRNGSVPVPSGPGIGFTVDREYIQEITKHQETFQLIY